MALFVDSAVRSCDCDGALEQLCLHCHDFLLLQRQVVWLVLSGFHGILWKQMGEAAGVMYCGREARASLGSPLHRVFEDAVSCCTLFLEVWGRQALVARLFVDLSYINFVLFSFIVSNARPCLLFSGFSLERLEGSKNGAT